MEKFSFSRSPLSQVTLKQRDLLETSFGRVSVYVLDMPRTANLQKLIHQLCFHPSPRVRKAFDIIVAILVLTVGLFVSAALIGVVR